LESGLQIEWQSVPGAAVALCEHGRVTRLLAALLAVSVVILLTGCSSDDGAEPPAVAASSPQVARLGWVERSPVTGPALVFHTHRLAVTGDGWEADVEIRNETGIAWEIATDPVAVARSFGLMLFATGTLAEVEERGADGDLPGLRSARSFVPALPRRLAPGTRWRGTVSADGALATGRFLRVVFGPLVADGDPPGDLPDRFVWITDHAYELKP